VNELSTTTFPAPVQAFLDDAEERGAIDESALEAFAVEHELDDEELSALRAELDVRAVDLVTAVTDEPHVAPASTDSLTLFMNSAGRYKLLSPSTYRDASAGPGRYAYSSATQKIAWLSGPYRRYRYKGEYQPKGTNGHKSNTIVLLGPESVKIECQLSR
jgi:hypothetical protein